MSPNGRQGESNHSAKLTETEVKMIRASSLPVTMLAETFDVHRRTIWLIRKGETWKHILAE